MRGRPERSFYLPSEASKHYRANDYLHTTNGSNKHSVLDIILIVLVELILQPIGDFIRWVLFRKKTLKEYVNDDWEGNLAAFLLTVAVVAVVVILVTI